VILAFGARIATGGGRSAPAPFRVPCRAGMISRCCWPRSSRSCRSFSIGARGLPARYRLARGETADVACTVDIDEHGAVHRCSSAAVARTSTPRRWRPSGDSLPRRRSTASPRRCGSLRLSFRIRQSVERAARRPHDQGRRRGGGNRRPVAGAEIATMPARRPRRTRRADTARDGAWNAQLTFSPRASTTAHRGRGDGERPGRAPASTAPRAAADLQATIPGETPHDRPPPHAHARRAGHVPGSLNDPIRAVQNLPASRARRSSAAPCCAGSPPQEPGPISTGTDPATLPFLGGPR